MKRKDRGFPYDAAPDVHQFRGVPQNCFDLVNQYGTYNIQPTTDTENLFPLIGPEMPERWRRSCRIRQASCQPCSPRQANSPRIRRYPGLA